MLKRKEKKWLAEGVVTGKAQSVMELLEDLGTVPDEIDVYKRQEIMTPL